MVAAVVGMIPEGLYLLASVALVVSVIRLASQKVLVQLLPRPGADVHLVSPDARRPIIRAEVRRDRPLG